MPNKGSQLWQQAKQLIPGGNQLLSKRSEMFLPQGWPAYYQKAKGVSVWDLEGREYIDMSIMGMGACILGYAHDRVNEVVKTAIDQGNMNTLNCYEEVELAQKLIELHPWPSMVRFARTGGEACELAIRISRAASHKDKIAFCGYHGWKDWYLSANLNHSDNLKTHLLDGLEPRGVPQVLKDSVFPFHYGDLSELKNIFFSHQDIGTIIMEVQRNKIDVEFLKGVRQLATERKAHLIFDEVSSGFHLRTGGSHLLYDVNPDLVVLGKKISWKLLKTLLLAVLFGLKEWAL